MKVYDSYTTYASLWNKSFPSHWEVLPIFAVAKEKSTCNCVDLQLLSVYLDSGVIPFSDKAEKRTNVTSQDLSKYQRVDNGDFVLNNQQAWRGSVGISFHTGIVSPAYIVLSMSELLNSKYANYLLRSRIMVDQYLVNSKSVGSIQRNIYWATLKRTRIIVPPRAEQDQIVRFLDWKVSEINRLIRIQKKEIHEFNHLKNNIISSAVTKGLRDEATISTGNKYYPDVPDGWQITKTLRVLTQPLTDGPHTTPELFDEGIPFVSAEAVSQGNGRIDFNHIRGYISQEFYDECCKKYIPQIDDVYMIKSGATTGRVAIVDTDRVFTIWSPLAVFRCNKSIMLPKFLFYALQALPYQQEVQDGWSYGTQQNIGMRVIEQLKIAYPDTEEQTVIVQYLDDICAKIEGAIKKLEEKITNLQDLKVRLVADAVTGKIDVRGIEIPEYEYVDDDADGDAEGVEDDENTEEQEE